MIGEPAGPDGAQNAYQGGGSSKVPLAGPNANVVTPLQGITTRGQAEGDTVTYTRGTTTAETAAAASAADVAIVFARDAATEGADRPDLALTTGTCAAFGCSSAPAGDAKPDDVIAAAAAANPNTIVVLQTGAPVTMPWLAKVKGVVETWYPGQEDGNAAAAVLFGDVNPSGKLPYTFPKQLADNPLRTTAQYPGVPVAGDSVGKHSTYSERLLVGYRWCDAKGIAPLFPFGYGLSYTTFGYSGLKVARTASGATATFTVKNTGSRAGAEVAQLYLGMPAAAGEPPKQLKGFQKVSLTPGQTKQVTIRLDNRAFSHWDTSTHGWAITPGTYTLRVGGSSTSLPLRGAVTR